MARRPLRRRSDASPSARRPWLTGFAAFNAFAAWGGGIGLISGGADFGDAINERLPFDSLVLAGLALVTIVGVPLTALGWSAWKGGSRTDDLALAAGVLLLVWIVGQIAVIRAFSLFQPAYLAVGAGFVAASHRISPTRTQRGLLLCGLGSVLVAVGIGLLPHPIKNGLTATSVVAIVVLQAGLGSLGVGAVLLLRGRRPFRMALRGAAVVILLLGVVAVVAPAIAATVVPSTEVGATPADVGLGYESVTLTTADDVDLAAWYVAGSNGAGVVVLHGAGSTRSDVLDEAEVLHRHGYSVLLVDARGHGDSGGAAMDFGWYGDLDTIAGVDFLSSLADVDPGRIGVVGFSMGGEEAIGAAAADPRIHAVVAEGATARQADDKDWLSDEYGVRGWLQEQIECLQYGITDYLTEAGPPTALRSAVSHATATHFLLVTAGDVDDERHAAQHLAAAAPERVSIWTVEGAGHVDGYDTRPEEWEERVIGFLDEHLA